MWRPIGRKGRGHKNPQKRCQRCGKFMTAKQAAIWYVKYCSMSCAKTTTGSTLVKGRGASSHHRDARKFLGPKCERCGSKVKLLVHHKNEDVSDQSRRNRETLCHPCHQKHHRRKKHDQAHPGERSRGAA